MRFFAKMKAHFTFYQNCNYISLRGYFTEANKKMNLYDFIEWEDPNQYLVLATSY